MTETYKLPPGEWASWGSCEWSLYECPFCGEEKKFTWNVEEAHGSCFVCKKAVTGWRYFNYLTKDAELLDTTYERKQKVYSKISTKYIKNAWDCSKSRTFLISRGVSELTTRKCDIKFLEATSTLYIDTYPISPDLPTSHLWRSIPRGKWFHKTNTKGIYYAWNSDKFANSGKNVLICEGIFDLLSTELYDIGIAVLGSNLNNIWFRWFKKNCKKLVLWFDPDDAGDHAVESISAKCRYYGVPYSVVKSKRPPKHYDGRIEKDKQTLDIVRQEVNNNSLSWSRKYINILR